MKNIFKLFYKISLLVLFSFLFGTRAYAVVIIDPCAVSGLQSILCRIGQLMNYVLPIIILLGVIYFVWGVVQYVIADTEEAKVKGRDSIIYGIIGLTVIVAMWGLVRIVQNTFGLNDDNQNKAPSSTDIKNLLPS
ncbi:hypothetical protein IT399_01530 [Candidatus Nomurabacteria bacterium]|nr:hypothetical protein [Candidatus Nomurabacteria bacterium]